MAIDQWRWPLQIQGNQSTQVKDRLRSVQFGDGYDAITPEGINWQHRTVPIIFMGNKKDALQVEAFLNDHKVSPFKIVPPGGVLGLYRTQKDSVSLTPSSSNVFTVSATIEQAYGFYTG
ncbi:minor tail protein [Pectobacterium phage Ymer]|uniref:Minor tail protein n=2 Tax=unclassified Caudoviricetes TaxID=2788787 RepID=A0AB39ABE8_9CAUD|nr:hypothetical protein Abuela_6 [Pectobacterium phage Abuela]WCD42781.1 minor tail protein [Pectobacterium phage Ymer]